MRTLVKYRLAGTQEVRSEDLSMEEAHHWTKRQWLYPFCDYLEFHTVDWEWIVEGKVVKIDPLMLQESTKTLASKKAAKQLEEQQPVLLSRVNYPEVKPMSASAPVKKAPQSSRREEDQFKIPLICKRSGIPLGNFVPSVGLAVATPYVVAWRESSYVHPIFSLGLGALITRSLACWQLEKSGTRQFPMQHKQLLFLAMLHASGCIKQDVAGLPSAKIVETHFPRLIEMLSWKHETASDRVNFPKLHVWNGADRSDKGNLFVNVPAWLDATEQCKEDYENVARERQKVAKVKAHELALKSIRKQMYGDVSLKRLWNWYKVQVPQMVQETNIELEQLFFCEERQIHLWQLADIEALESIFLKYCETGTSVSFEFNKRLRQLADFLATYNDTFEIVDEARERFAEYRDVAAPVRSAFPNNAAFLIASARWQLANKASAKPAISSKPATKKIQGEDL